MKAAETIAAAIEKLEGLKGASTPGEWVVRGASIHGTSRKYQPLIDAGDFASSAERFENPVDAELLVTLHGTIDAQLRILTIASEDIEQHGDSEMAVEGIYRPELLLARAILGEAS
jgi:hypothetical protein